MLLALSGCAHYPQLVLLNPRTGATVDCQVPDQTARPGDYLVARACMSACEAHGFHPVPGMPAGSNSSAGTDIPSQCSN